MYKFKTVTILTMILLIASCNEEEKKRVATISGKVISGDVKQIKFTLYNRPPQIRSDTYIAELDSSSNFSIEIPIERLRYGRLNVGSTYDLSLSPYDDIFISINGDSVNFSGEGAEKNKFLYEAKANGLSDKAYYHERNKADKSPEDFLKAIKKLRESRSDFMNTYPNKNELNKEFRHFYEIHDQVTYERQIVVYPKYYARRNKINIDSVQLPQEYTRLSKFANIIDDSKIISRVYINTIQTLIWENVGEICESDSSIDWQQVQQTIVFDSLTGKTQEYVLAGEISKSFTYRAHYDTLAINKFNALDTDEYSTQVVDNAIKKHNEKQSLIGEPLHAEFANTVLVDTANTELKFVDLLKNNYGKIVYLDIWSTWCGPCKMEMQYSNNLKKNMKEMPIEFVYVSVDKSDSENWQRVYDMTFTKNNHYVFENEFNARMLKFMELNGVPNYMIFDKKGRLVDYQATRPSNPDTEKRLRELAKEL